MSMVDFTPEELAAFAEAALPDPSVVGHYEDAGEAAADLVAHIARHGDPMPHGMTLQMAEEAVCRRIVDCRRWVPDVSGIPSHADLSGQRGAADEEI